MSAIEGHSHQSVIHYFVLKNKYLQTVPSFEGEGGCDRVFLFLMRKGSNWPSNHMKIRFAQTVHQ